MFEVNQCKKTHRYAREDLKLQFLFEAAQEEEYVQIVEAFKKEAKLKDLPQQHPAREFRDVWDNLSLIDEKEGALLVLDDTRIVVPRTARRKVLEKLHLSHSGVSKTRRTAAERYYWPHLSKTIAQVCEACEVCRRSLPSQWSEPMSREVKPYADLEVMEEVSVDLFDLGGRVWLVLVDRLSSMPMCKQISRGTTDEVVTQLSKWFYWSGWPERLRSDNGPCFRGKFSRWCEDHGIRHETSSAYNAASNGLAEAGVARTKKVLKRARECGQPAQLALQEFRNTKMSNGPTPSNLFYGRRLRGELPALKVDVNK